MLFHHSTKDYTQAASDAATRARNKLEAMIDHGQQRAEFLMDKLQNEVPTDRLVAPKSMRFEINGQSDMILGGDSYQLHPHARGQVIDATKGLLSRRVANAMIEAGPWGKQLLTDALNRIYGHLDRDRMLVREVDGQVRAVLSERFRRMDSAPIIEAFAGACGAKGAVPVESHASDTKWALKVLLPQVFEPIDNEVLAYGVVLQNSDYGDGALSIRAFMLRLWCTNYAIRDEALRQVHLGKRLSDDMIFSQETYTLDTRAMASAVKDIVGNVLAPERILGDLRLIQEAHENQIDASKTIESLRKKNLLTKGEASKVVETFNAPEVELLPPGNSMWRLSNALSLFAQRQECEGRRLEMEQLAGVVLGG